MRLEAVVPDEDLLEAGEVVDAPARAAGHRAQGVLGDLDRNPELVAHPLVEATQQGSAAGQRDAPVQDVAGELRRAHVERGPDELDDLQDGALDGSADL